MTIHMTIQEKFQQFRDSLNTSLVERESEIDLVLTGLIAKENPLLVGLPGTAKSQLLDSIASWMESKPFPYLLTKFTDPAELFGPIDLESLKRGFNKRNVDGYLPTSHFVFLDEVFKASSAILNTLLKCLNERIFKYGLQELEIPLILCVAASNEWPNPETMQELGALFDRFLLRKKVRPVSNAGRKLLIQKSIAQDPCKPNLPDKITTTELEEAHRQSLNIDWTEESVEALHQILEELNRDGIFPGDRRIFKSTKVVRAKAWMEGADEVLPEHLESLSHVLWVDPQEQPEHCEKIVVRIANPLGAVLYDYQQQLFEVEEKANEKLKDLSRSDDRRRIIEEVIQKSKEIETDLKTRKDSPLRNKILTYVTESKKTWQRKLLGISS